MSLDTKALALTAGIVWGGGFFLVALVNLVFPAYGISFLNFGASIYPGYQGPGGVGSIVVVTLYALVDGAVTGAVFGWLYNRFAARPA